MLEAPLPRLRGAIEPDIPGRLMTCDEQTVTASRREERPVGHWRRRVTDLKEFGPEAGHGVRSTLRVGHGHHADPLGKHFLEAGKVEFPNLGEPGTVFDDWARLENARAHQCPGLDGRSPTTYRVERPAQIPDRSHAELNEMREGGSPTRLEVDVSVPQAGNQKSAGAGYSLGPGGERDLAGRADRSNPSLLDQHGAARQWHPGLYVNHRHSFDGYALLSRGF